MAGNGVLTESKEHGAHLVVQTRISCVEGPSLVYKTLWTMSDDRRRAVQDHAELEIGSMSIRFDSGPTPLNHVTAVRTLAAAQSGESVTVDVGTEHIQKDFQFVYLATREQGCEVFADDETARFWAAGQVDVKKVSLRTASAALKTDEETVIESAIAATQATRLEMRIARALVRLAESLQVRLRVSFH